MNLPPDDPSAYRFCLRCGGEFHRRKLKDHEPERLVCGNCDFVFFLNPKVAAGAICHHQGGLVLARRAIEPGYGKWVFPGGFVDRGETVPDAAIRETREEVCLDVEIRELLGVYSYSGAPVVVIVYAAEVTGGRMLAADECLEARAFAPEAIPWKELAFPSTRDALKSYIRRYHCPGSDANERLGGNH